MDSVCILGGSGFVGRHLAGALVREGFRVRVATRRPESSQALWVLPSVEVVRVGSGDAADLARAFAGVDAVVNLVGILHGDEAAFRRAHVDLVQAVVGACRAVGVTRYLHMSALGAADDAPSRYLRSKAEGERIALASKLEVTAFRPSVVFGEDDRFLNTFATLLSLFPVIPLACPEARFQPVWVNDLARAMASTLEDPAAWGRTFEVCGPRAYSLRDLVRFVGATTGRERPIVGLSEGLSTLQATLMECMPVKLMSRDNVRSMQRPSVCDCDFQGQFGFAPAALETTAPAWLAPRGRRSRYDDLRARAGR